MKLSKRKKKKLIAIVIVVLFICLNIYAEKSGWNAPLKSQVKQADQITTAGSYKVTRFDDGDTIMVMMDSKEETIRFIGVDTPEVKDPRKPVQCFGKEASEFTKKLIGDQPVRLEADPKNTNRDRYNRLLRYIYLPDNTLVNAEIIKQGYGFAYVNFPTTKKDEFLELQNEAKSQNRGLWAVCQPIQNKYGGFTSNPE